MDIVKLLAFMEKQLMKHTNISSTNQGHGLCYYFFIVEVKESRTAPWIYTESVLKTG